MPVPLLMDARLAGWVNGFRICASTMPKAQNRTAKGSFLKEDEILCPSGSIIYLWSHAKHATIISNKNPGNLGASGTTWQLIVTVGRALSVPDAVLRCLVVNELQMTQDLHRVRVVVV